MSAQLTDAVLTVTEPEPRTRIRVNHSRTIKEGWGYETTVEIEFAAGDRASDDEALARLSDLLAQVRFIGEAERDSRNSDDGRPS